MKKINYLLLCSLFGLLVIFQSCKEDEPAPPTLDEPGISVSETSVSFGDLDLNQESDVSMVGVTAEFLKGDVGVTIPDGFQGSLTEDSGFGAELTIDKGEFEGGASVSLYLKAVPADGYEGPLSGNVVLSSTEADDVTIALSANVALVITGQLFMSEYLEQYSTNWETTLPLDSGILHWTLNTDTVVNQANNGGGYPETTIPNNEVMNTWYQPVPLNGTGIRSSQSISATSDLSITGYPSVSGARNIVLVSGDESELFNWFHKSQLACKGANTNTGNNTSIGRRFALDGYKDDVFMSAMVNVNTLGSEIAGKPNDYGSGDIIALANAISGPSNNNTIKVVALTNGSGGFHFGLLKENEGNPTVLSTESYDLNTTYAVVLSHEFVEGDNNDVSKLYVFAEGDEIPTSMDGLTPVAILDDTYTDGVDPTDLTIVYLRERNQSVNAPEASVTGIRVGDTWIATLFEDHANAINSNDLTLNNRVLTNKGSDCTP